MSLHDSLESDLRIISTEGKKKSSQIKDLADKALLDLRKSPIIPSDSILQVVESVKGVGVVKIYTHIINILQKLLTHHLIDSISIISVLEFLSSTILEINEESLQLKSLQTIMLVLNPQVVILTEDLVGIVWKLSLSLQNFKSVLVRNTASASLRQLVDVTFEKLHSCRDRSESFEAKSIQDSSNMLFRYINELVAGNHILWTADKNKMKTEGVGLLISIISAKSFLKCLNAEWKKELERTLVVLKDNLNEFIEEGYTNLCIIACVHIINLTQTGYEHMIRIRVYIENRQYPDWLKISSLESLILLLKKPNTLENLVEDDILVKLFDSCGKSAQDLIENDDSKNNKTKIKLVIEILSHLIECFTEYFTRCKLILNEGVLHDKIAEQLLSNLWKPTLALLSQLLQINLSENQLQSVLNVYQSMVNFTGTFAVIQGKEGIISSLTVHAKPTGITLTYKQLLCFKTLLNVAHGLHSILDMKSWHRILNNLQVLDSFLKGCKNEDETSILRTALDNLFTSTESWPLASLTELIGALGQLALEYMEALSSNDKKVTVHRIFGLDKLIVLTLSNLNRAHQVWDNIAVYLDCTCNSKSIEIKYIGISSLSKLIVKLFKHFVDYPPQVSDSSKWKNWQKTLFASLNELASQQEAEVYKSIYTILQSCGAQLDKSGWTVLLSILFDQDLGVNSGLAFKCLNLIVNDFLESEELLSCLGKLVNFISKFANSKDINQSIGAVGMYWNLADYLGRVRKEEEESWWLVLGKLKELGQDPRPEVRNSAIHSLHVALTTHGSCLSQKLWKRIMENIILDLLRHISCTYFNHATLTQEVPILEPQGFIQAEPQESPPKKGKKNLQISIPTDLAHPLVSETPKFAGKIEIQKEDKIIIHHSRDTLEKQWEETFHIFTQNLGKLFRTYLSNLEKSDEDVFRTPTLKKNWDLLILRLKEGLDHGTTNIITAVLKAVKELLSCPKVSTLFFNKWNSSWEIFVTLSNRLQVSSVNIPHKLILIILEDLNLIYSAEYKEPYQEKCLHTLYLLLNGLLEATKLEATLSQCKILQEQKEVFDFLEKFSGFLLRNKGNLTTHLRFLLKFCKYDGQDSHSDAMCRRALQGLEAIIAKEPTCIVPVVNDILGVFEDLLIARYDPETLLLMNVTCKGGLPLFYVAGESFLRLLPLVMKYNCWDKLLDLLSKLLIPDQSLLESISKTSLEDMMKTSEKLDIQICKAITDQLIPASMTMQSLIQVQLIDLLDKGCDNYYQVYRSYEFSVDESFSFACLAGLFELSRLREPTKEEEDKKPVAEDPLYLKVAKKTTPVLIKRCQELLQKFVNEEKEMGIMPLPKHREIELVQLLGLIKKLEVPEGVLPRPGRKAHLFELYLVLCDLVVAKEVEVKEALRDVLVEFFERLV